MTQKSFTGFIEYDIIASVFKRLLFYLIQWIWGFPQNIAGLFIYLAGRNYGDLGRYHCARVTRWNRKTSMSMGMFIFLGTDAGERLLRHEYGHSIQSLVLGPFYLIAVGIPSAVWCNFGPIAKKWKSGFCSYYSVYPEKWADNLGHVPEFLIAQNNKNKCTETKSKTT